MGTSACELGGGPWHQVRNPAIWKTEALLVAEDSYKVSSFLVVVVSGYKKKSQN